MSVQSLTASTHVEQQNIYTQNMEIMLQAAYRLGKIEQGLQDQGLLLVAEHKRLKHEITQLKDLHQVEKKTLLTSARNQVDAIGRVAYKITTYIEQELNKAKKEGLFPGCHDSLLSMGRKLGAYQAAIRYGIDYKQFCQQSVDLYNYYSKHPAKSFFEVGAFDLILKKVNEELKIKKGQVIQLSSTEMPLSLQALANQLSIKQKIEQAGIDNAEQLAKNKSLDQQKHELIETHAETIKRFRQENLSGMQTCLKNLNKRKEWHEAIVTEFREKFLLLDTRQLENVVLGGEYLQNHDMSKEILNHLDELIVSLNRYIGSIKI